MKKFGGAFQMKARNHFCEYEVLSEEHNLVACTICGNMLSMGVEA